MWLKRLEITNFRSIDNLCINFSPGINVIYGENGTGKTNIIKSILKIFGPNYPGLNSFQKEDHFFLENSNEIKIKFTFVDGDKEIEFRWDRDSRYNEYHPRLIKNSWEYVNSEEREKFCPLHIPPSREIRELPGSSKWTAVGRIIFELSKIIDQNPDVKDRFDRSMRECRETLQECPEFSSFSERVTRYSQEHIGNRGGDVKIELGLIDQRNLLKTLQIFEQIDGRALNLCDGGNGIQSTVTMAILRAFSDIRGDSIYLIADEPEAYLHPLAQQSLCHLFEEIAERGTQIILTTHSPHFISSNHLEGLIKVWMDNGITQCKQFDLNELTQKRIDRGISNCTEQSVGARLSRLMTLDIKEGLFGKVAVLCEGESEGLSLAVWAKCLDLHLARKGIAVVQSNGKFSMIDLAEFYQSMNIPVYLLFDSDSDCSEQERRNHIRNNIWLLQFAQSENIVEFPETTIQRGYSVLSPNFEAALTADDPNYTIIEAEVNAEYGLERERHKGVRAKLVAQSYLDAGRPAPEPIKGVLNEVLEYCR